MAQTSISTRVSEGELHRISQYHLRTQDRLEPKATAADVLPLAPPLQKASKTDHSGGQPIHIVTVPRYDYPFVPSRAQHRKSVASRLRLVVQSLSDLSSNYS